MRMVRGVFEGLRVDFAAELMAQKMFKTKKDSPGGEGFRLKLHQSKPDAPLSPFYLDLRMLRSYPRGIKATAVKLLRELVTHNAPSANLLADVPTAITPIVSSL